MKPLSFNLLYLERLFSLFFALQLVPQFDDGTLDWSKEKTQRQRSLIFSRRNRIRPQSILDSELNILLIIFIILKHRINIPVMVSNKSGDKCLNLLKTEYLYFIVIQLI